MGGSKTWAKPAGITPERLHSRVLRQTWQLVSEEATAALAAGLASVLRPGDVVALQGELGAGKTTFTRGLAAALGADAGLVSSPTFVFVHVYPVAGNGTNGTAQPDDASAGPPIRRLVHVDAYRLTSDEDLEGLGWDQLFDSHTKQAASDAVALVEWPERIASKLPEPSAMATLRIRHLREGVRAIEGTFPDAWATRPLMELFLGRPPAVCPKTRVWVSPTAPTYPFANERARGSDLFGWLTEGYSLPRAIKPEDEE